jgi:hypothetical protein
MKKYIFVILLTISSNIYAVDTFLTCNSNLYLQKVSPEIIKIIKNICSYKLLGYRAVFTVTPEQLPSSCYKKIYKDNFYIIDRRRKVIYITFHKFINIFELPAPAHHKKPLFFGGIDMRMMSNYPWLQNWFNENRPVNLTNKSNRLVEASIKYINHLFQGVNTTQYSISNTLKDVHKHEHENTYQHALIGVCVVGAIALIATNLINYLYFNKYKLKKGRTILLNSNEDDSISTL